MSSYLKVFKRTPDTHCRFFLKVLTICLWHMEIGLYTVIFVHARDNVGIARTKINEEQHLGTLKKGREEEHNKLRGNVAT